MVIYNDETVLKSRQRYLTIKYNMNLKVESFQNVQNISELCFLYRGVNIFSFIFLYYSITYPFSVCVLKKYNYPEIWC